MHFLAFAFVALQSDARPLSSRIQSVTVFADRALVHRAADVPAGGGKFVVTGLPLGADPEQVHVRCPGGDVTDVDVTEVRVPAMPDARREDLRRQLVELGREEATMADEQATVQEGIASAIEVLNVASRLAKVEMLSGKLDVAAWSSQQDALLARVRLQKEASRSLDERRAEAARRRQELQQALGSADVAGGVVSRQVALEVIAASATVLEVEYVVSSAGWRPTYDLRAASDARSVQLVYRADVFQQSGEDWNDVDVSLSTATPQVGAQGPEPRPSWVSFFAPEHEEALRLRGLGYDGDSLVEKKARLETGGMPAPAEAPPPRPFASVESQGLSVRFHLPKQESLPSRPEPTRVLVAEETLQVTPEYFCTPELDANVWLRGKAKNTTAWTILPGRAAVYFGADFLGHAQLGAVQPGEELTLHLGRDPGFTLERVQTENQAKQPGVFSSRTTQVDGWRLKIKNNGALVAAADGTATVFVRESLPRATDDRIKVELADAKPEPSADERWKKDRDEQGIVTWAVRVPRGGETAITWRLKVSFPEGSQITR